MSHKNRLFPWCIVRHLPNLQRYIVARFRRRNDAEAHLRLIRTLSPNIPYEIVFDLSPDDPDFTPPSGTSP